MPDVIQMRLSRIYVPLDLAPLCTIRADSATSHYLRRVLRLRPESDLILFNGDGHDYLAEFTGTDGESAMLRIKASATASAPPTLVIRLAIGVSKGERMDFVMQKAVELGVSEITPLITEHGVVQLRGERGGKRLDHWRRVIVSACEQCGRNRIPQLNDLCSLGDWLHQRAAGTAVLLDHRSTLTIPQLPPPPGDITLLVGAEGGLSDTERHSALEHGLIGVRLGPRVLRTETAPLAALAAIQALWGDYR